MVQNRWCLGAAVLLVILMARAVAADCNRGCNAADRDERGCCPATPSKPATPPARPKPTPPIESPARRPIPKAPSSPKVTGPRIEVRADADPNVSGATVMLDGLERGRAPVSIEIASGRHLVELTKGGFERYAQWFEVVGNQTVTLTPALKAESRARYGTVIVEADVPGADVFIDGNRHPDTTPAVISNVIEGLHVIEVRKMPATPWKQTIQVTGNQQTKVRAELRLATGVVRVLSDTPGARAFLDGSDMGPVPVDIKDIKSGDHILQIKAAGFQTNEVRITVVGGSSQIVKQDLTQEARADVSSLKILAAVPDAMVFVDGAAVGKVPVATRVAPGEHFVVVSLAGYKKFEQRVRVEAGKSLTIGAELRAVGQLRVLSTPSGARVVINGFPRGVTPLEVELDTGQTVIRLELAGYAAWENTIDIRGGEKQAVSSQLAKLKR